MKRCTDELNVGWLGRNVKLKGLTFSYPCHYNSYNYYIEEKRLGYRQIDGKQIVIEPYIPYLVHLFWLREQYF